MKIAVISDIHANQEALEAVLAHAREQRVNSYICLGDVVGYNANPIECLEMVRELKCVCVRGNHDHVCGGEECLDNFHPLAASVIRWTREQLTDEQKHFLRNLPLTARVESFAVVHSTLDMPEKWGYVFDKYQAEANFTYQMNSLCFFGHTHVPIAFEKSDAVRAGLYTKIRIARGHKYFINVGSVGQPRDGDTRASYAIYDLMENTVTLHRVEYDLTVTQKKILAAGLPNRMAARLAQGR